MGPGRMPRPEATENTRREPIRERMIEGGIPGELGLKLGDGLSLNLRSVEVLLLASDAQDRLRRLL